MCLSRLQLGVTFQQSLVLGNTSHYPVNPSLMIGDYVTPGNGISPQTYRQWSTAKSFRIENSRKTKQLQCINNRHHNHRHPSYHSHHHHHHHHHHHRFRHRHTNVYNGVNVNATGSNRQTNRRLVFSSPVSKLRLASAVRVLHADDFANLDTSTKLVKPIVDRVGRANTTSNSIIEFGWLSRRLNTAWGLRWRRLHAVLSS